jgi:hypothetical protein
VLNQVEATPISPSDLELRLARWPGGRPFVTATLAEGARQRLEGRIGTVDAGGLVHTSSGPSRRLGHDASRGLLDQGFRRIWA